MVVHITDAPIAIPGDRHLDLSTARPSSSVRAVPSDRRNHRVVIYRLRWDPRTRAYTERRTKEGRSKAEIIRCLKRYVAREIYNELNQQPA